MYKGSVQRQNFVFGLSTPSPSPTAYFLGYVYERIN
jgi:hypothetical protein